MSPLSVLRTVTTCLATLVCLASAPSSATAAALDTVVFGDAASESAHTLTAPDTEVLSAALGEPARRALAKAPVEIYGASSRSR